MSNQRIPKRGSCPLLFPLRLLACLLVSCGGTLFSAEPAPENSVPSGEGWVQLSISPKLAVYCRARKGSSGKEYKAFGSIAAPNWAVERVLEDAPAYPQFMPYVAECKVLEKDAEGTTTYQRISAPFVRDRDYVLRIQVEARPSKAGTVYLRSWSAAPKTSVPEQPGTIRVKVVEGSWVLEPTGETTHAIYSVFTDPAGTIPAAILNYANHSAIPKIFAAIEKQAGEKKYRKF